MTDIKSIADLLRESVENAPADEPLEVRIPVYDPGLYMSLRKVKDFHITSEAMSDVEAIKDETDQALQIAARTLVLACDHTYVEAGGQRHKLPPIGLGLYSEIFPNREPAPMNDVQAVFSLYTDASGECDTVAVVQAAAAYGDWRQETHNKAQETVLGELAPGDTRPLT